MIRKYSKLILLLLTVLLIGSSCKSSIDQNGNGDYKKYDFQFFDTFDTQIVFTEYSKSEKQFQDHSQKVHEKFTELHKLYDRYNDYEGINNIKTINDNAGKSPVKVEQEIIDLLHFSIDNSKKYKEKTNIAMGAVLELWHQSREEGIKDPKNAKIPDKVALEEAAEHIDIDKVIIDDQEKTVYLEDPEMSLDLGATAKGYATQLVIDRLKKENIESAIISAGGNVETIGKPMEEGRGKWGIGLQNPLSLDDPSAEKLFDVVFANDQSVVTSGDYQRYYTVGEDKYHHIIDPETLMPANHFKAVTVVTADSGFADFMSTTLFLLPLEEGRIMAKEAGVEVLWFMNDHSIITTPGMDEMLKSKGANNQ